MNANKQIDPKSVMADAKSFVESHLQELCQEVILMRDGHRTGSRMSELRQILLPLHAGGGLAESIVEAQAIGAIARG